MVDITALWNDIAVEILISAFIGLLTWIYRKNISSWVKKASYYLTNEEVQLEVKRVDKYKKKPVKGLDMPTFKEIQRKYRGGISHPELQDNQLMLRAEGIPTKITVKIVEQHNFTEGISDVEGYKLVIKSDTELRFGYRSDEALREFENLSECISEVINNDCFEMQKAEQSFVLAKMKRGAPPGEDEITDEKLGLQASRKDSVMQFTFKNPRNLSQGIKKYFKLT
ncbi:hypothetical protein AMS69_15730 [Haloarcula rubripromontorii]|uniref:Uncharacterized protein n=1 Tax=Haloarcula rubripromontorii TaxID=1705562 RepID=A0A0M9AJA6_9EURY|nr:hypothetical protein [Haloarcula rubripromontorii]KOX91995.1 hypothetical protein AMS69_15730 [Haloarcula rubripromontorii]